MNRKVRNSNESNADEPQRTRDADSADVVPSGNQSSVEDVDENEQRIALLAYLKAEERHFAPGFELDDWLAAEAEVNANNKRNGRSPDRA